MRRRLIALLALAALTTGCSRPQIQQQEAYVFGTRVEVLVAGSDPENGRAAVAAVLREFDRLHRTYHAWQPSELTAVNDSISAGKSARVSPELAQLIDEAKNIARRGDYLFDPGIGHLIRIWGFQSDEFQSLVPQPEKIDSWLQARPSVADVEVRNGVVTSRNNKVALDFGGYLKGVALDRAASILQEQGVGNALINIGGNIMALGSKNGRPWKVGIQHPRQPGPMATIELQNGEAIGTSGDYQRYFEANGKRYSHLLDPRTGYPATHTQAITVLITGKPEAGTWSDAGSKPIFIAGPDKWREKARRLGIEAVLRVDASGRVFVTPAMSQRLEFLTRSQDGEPEIVP